MANVFPPSCILRIRCDESPSLPTSGFGNRSASRANVKLQLRRLDLVFSSGWSCLLRSMYFLQQVSELCLPAGSYGQLGTRLFTP